MPLRDHFHMPLRGLCTWESLRSGWTLDHRFAIADTAFVARKDLAEPLGLEQSYEATFGELRVPI